MDGTTQSGVSAGKGSGVGRRVLLQRAGAALGMAGVSGCQGLPGVRNIQPAVTVPQRSLIGAPFPVELSHFPANTDTTVEVSVTDARGEPFSRTVRTRTDADGNASVGEELRTGGTVPFATRSDRSSSTTISDGVGGDGPVRMLFHHLTPDGDPSPPTFVATGGSGGPAESGGGTPATRHEVTVEATAPGSARATTAATRVLSAPTVREQRVPAEDLVGWLYTPPGRDPVPGIILFHGSRGNPARTSARLYATQGYAALAIQYLDDPAIPGTSTDIPLEYFDRAVEWLTGRENVLGDRLGTIGGSLGAEPAFLTAGAFDGPAAAIGISSGALLTPTNDDDPVRYSRNGEPIVTREEVERRGGKAYGIAVERVEGPVLVVTGREDHLADPYQEGEYTAWRLSRHDHPHPYAHVTYEDAGHLILNPYLDYRAIIDDARDRTGFRRASPTANARAAVDRWVRVLDYLEHGLAAGHSGI